MLKTIPEHTTEKVKAGKKSPEKETPKPKCILDCKDSKKDVDYSDQMTDYSTPQDT